MSSKARYIRALKPEDMDQYIEIYLNSYPANKSTGDEGRVKYKARNLESMNDFDDVNFYGMFEGDELIAQMKLIDFSMNLFGEMKPAMGLMALGVHPLHKKKGAAHEMVEFFERYTQESGGLVSLLLPFRMDFYRSMGYGCGSKMDEYHIPTVQLPKCEKSEIARMRFLTQDEADDVMECYSRFAAKNHGALLKFGEEIRDIRDDDEVRRIGYFDEGILKGYAAFIFENTSEVNYTLNLLDVKELVYEDGKVLKALLGALRMQSDLAQSVKIRTGEPDFYHLLDSPQNVTGGYIDFGFLETNTGSVGTMYKIVDIPKFVSETSYRVFPCDNLKLGLEVYDEMKKSTANYVVAFEEKDGVGRWKMAEGGVPDVILKCRLSDLSALMMGSAELSALLRLGVMELSDDSFKDRLNRLLYCDQKPFTNTDY